MKLYATTTSERASKGQGGNDYLNIDLKVHDRDVSIGSVELYLNKDTDNHGSEQDEWVLNWYPKGQDEPVMIAQGHATQKGKK